MTGLGTIINVIGILIGGLMGMLFGKLITPRIQDTLMKANGVCVLFLGISGTLKEMFSVENGQLTSSGTMMMIISLAAGALIEEWINLGIFSAIPVAILQGTVTLLARAIEPVMTEAALGNLSLVGNILIFCVGVNLVWENTRIKVANMLPSIVIAVAWAFIP